MVRKLISRKLWMAIAGVTSGIAMALGIDSNDIAIVSGAITTLTSIVTYIITEGKVDAAGVKNAVEASQNAVEVIENVADK